jgi:hypothetical protein
MDFILITKKIRPVEGLQIGLGDKISSLGQLM